MLERFFLFILRKFPPEIAHNIGLLALKCGLIPSKRKITNKLISINLFGYKLSNPIGLAAGFDKNAEGLPGLLKQNFSFIEVGTVTPLPQKGNIKPRIHRLTNQKSIINSLGFPNLGADKVLTNVNQVRKYHKLGHEPLIGVNIGYNKESRFPNDDFVKCFETFFHVSDYITINISSPNTPGLRKLQFKNKLEPLLKKLYSIRKKLYKKYKRSIPLVIKISPDLRKLDLKTISELSIKYNLQAIIATNTSVDKKLKKNNKIFNLEGGISGKLLSKNSNKILITLSNFTKGKIQIIGVGGIDSADSLLEKFENGANAVQLYSSLVYNGLSLIDKILFDLIKIIKSRGYKNISFINKNEKI